MRHMLEYSEHYVKCSRCGVKMYSSAIVGATTVQTYHHCEPEHLDDILYKGFSTREAAERFRNGCISTGTSLGWLLVTDNRLKSSVCDGGECPSRINIIKDGRRFGNAIVTGIVHAAITSSFCLSNTYRGAAAFGKYIVSIRRRDLHERLDASAYQRYSYADIMYADQRGLIDLDTMLISDRQGCLIFSNNLLFKSYGYSHQTECRYILLGGDSKSEHILDKLDDDFIDSLRAAYNSADTSGIQKTLLDSKNLRIDSTGLITTKDRNNNGDVCCLKTRGKLYVGRIRCKIISSDSASIGTL